MFIVYRRNCFRTLDAANPNSISTELTQYFPLNKPVHCSYESHSPPTPPPPTPQTVNSATEKEQSCVSEPQDASPTKVPQIEKTKHNSPLTLNLHIWLIIDSFCLLSRYYRCRKEIHLCWSESGNEWKGKTAIIDVRLDLRSHLDIFQYPNFTVWLPLMVNAWTVCTKAQDIAIQNSLFLISWFLYNTCDIQCQAFK